MVPPAALNANLLFTQLTDVEQASFSKAPAPEHLPLPKGTRLYKWTSYPLMRWKDTPAGRVAIVTQFWSNKDELKTPSGRVLPGFDELRKRYRNTGGSVGAPRDAARARLAVKPEWNTLDSILFAQLDQLVWGYAGVAGPQPMVGDDRHVLLMGGDWQLVIPHMAESHIHRIG